MPNLDTIPTAILPKRIAKILKDVTVTGCLPHNFIFASMMAAFSCAAKDCSLKVNATWTIRPNIYIALVAESGSKKTPAMNFILKPLSELDIISFEKYDKEIREYNVEKSNTSRPKPFARQLIARDMTTEAVAKIVAKNGSILLHQDELAGFFQGMNQYKRRGADQQFWLTLYSGGALTVNRSSKDEIIFSSNARASIIGGIQPGILPSIMPSRNYEDGLIQRFLFVFDPDDGKPSYFYPERNISEQCPEEWRCFLHNLITYASTLSKPMTLSKDAMEVYSSWYNTSETRAAEEGRLELSILRKMEEVVLKFALIDHVVNHRKSDIGPISIKNGIMLAKYFWETAIYVCDLVSSQPDEKGYAQMLRQLGRDFLKSEAEDVVARMGYCKATVYNWLNEGIKHGVIKRTAHAHYTNLLI